MDAVREDPVHDPGAPLMPLTPDTLARCLTAGLLEVLYQPVVRLRTGVIVAAEALVRLRDPTTGQLLPAPAFVPLAEQCGLITRLDALVAEAAVPNAVRWRALRPGRPFSLGLNVSAVSLGDGGLSDRIRALCERHGLPPEALVLELTETAVSQGGARDETALQRLADLGCHVTLDDFGTGFSSLDHLRRFPVAGVKIDRSFTWELGESTRGARVALALVRLAQDLELHVVAEGVETAGQLRALREAGCPFGQGYLFSRPVSAQVLDLMLPRRLGRIPLPRGAADEVAWSGSPALLV